MIKSMLLSVQSLCPQILLVNTNFAISDRSVSDLNFWKAVLLFLEVSETQSV